MLVAWLASAIAGELVPPRPEGALATTGPGLYVAAETVTVDVSVRATGDVGDVVVTSGDPELGAWLADEVRRIRFRPATDDGVPVDVVVPLTWTAAPNAARVVVRVRKAGARVPAEGVDLRVGDAGIVTDAEGLASVVVPAGATVLHLVEPGFRMDDVPLDVAAGEEIAVTAWVVEERWTQEIVGVYRRTPETTVRRTLTAEAIRESPGALGDPVRALQNVPGLARTPLDAGWLLVRGGGPDDTPVFLDGVRLPSLFHLGGLTSVVHPELVEQVDLYPGAAPARLSRGLSGAAELQSRGAADDTRVIGGMNLAFAHLFAEAPLGDDAGFAVAARRSYLDAALSLALGPERSRIAPRFWDVGARFDSKHAGLFLVGVWDEATFPSEEPGELDDAGQQALQAQGRLNARVGGVDWVARPVVARSVTSVDGFRQERAVETTPGVRVEASRTGDDGFRWLAGVEAARRSFAIARDGESREKISGWADPYVEVSGGARVRGRVGARLDTLFVSDQLPRFGFSPRADLVVGLDPKTSALASLWQTHQEPPRTFLLAYPDGPYLGLERSRGISAGLRHVAGNGGFEAQVYRREIEDAVAIEVDGTLEGWDGVAEGVETSAWWRGDRLRAEWIGQVGRSRERAEPGDALTPIRYEQPVRIVVLASYRLPGDVQIGGRFRYGSAVPSPAGGVSAYDILQGQERVTMPSKNGRLLPYYGLDLRVSKRATFRTWRLDAFLDVLNTTGRRIPEPAINGVDDTVFVYGYGLPILPLFGLDATFWP